MAKTKSTKATTKAINEAEVLDRYPHIKRVVALSPKQKVARVEILCTTDGCKNTREIAVQDCFQVSRCQSCQDEHAKAKRRKGKPKADKPKATKPKKRKPKKTNS